MELLMKKSRQGRQNIDGINITKSGISINGSSFNRLKPKGKNPIISCAIGINNDSNLCLYVAEGTHQKLFKMYIPKNQNRFRMSFNKSQSGALKPFFGNYSIKYVRMTEKDNMKEIILIKNS